MLRTVLRFSLLLVLTINVSTPVVEALEVTTSHQVVNSVRVREKPTSHSAIIGQLRKGQTLDYVGELPKWYAVRLPSGDEGYVHKSWTVLLDGTLSGDSEDSSHLVPAANRLQLHFIDVGQGDATLIVCPNGNRILVDAGSSANGSSQEVRNYLLQHLGQGDPTLAALVITHPDKDHYNYLPSVLQSVRVEHILYTGEEDDYSQEFRTWFKHIPSTRRHFLYKKTFDPVDQPNTFLACGDAKLHVLSASIPTTRTGKSNFVKNSLSTVLMIRYGTFNALLTGDATFDSEEVILQRYPAEWLKSDVLKIGHHGSRVTSTSQAWAEVVRPKLAIASAGEHSTHGHPSEEVVLRLEAFTEDDQAHPLTFAHGTKPYKWQEKEGYTEAIYNTADSGNIVVSTTGQGYAVTPSLSD